MSIRPGIASRIKNVRSSPLRAVTYTAAVPVAAIAIAGSFWLYGSGEVEAPSGPVKMAAMADQPLPEPTPEPEPEPAAPTINSAEKAERPVQEVAETELRLEPLTANDPRWRTTATARDAEEESLGGRFRPIPADADAAETASVATEEAAAATNEIASISQDTAGASPAAAASETETDAATDIMANVMASAVDTETTAAIEETAPELASGVQVAETDVEIAALEAAVAEAQAGRPDAAFVSEGIAMVPGTIKSYVNLRAGPSNDAEVLTIVPTDKRIEAQPLEQCVHFCQVVVDGQRGFIGKTFIAFDSPPETAEAE